MTVLTIDAAILYASDKLKGWGCTNVNIIEYKETTEDDYPVVTVEFSALQSDGETVHGTWYVWVQFGELYGEW
jgi:hypothetical protein